MPSSTEYQILEAYHEWHKAAQTIHPVESLPSDTELLAAAQDQTQLDPGSRNPALLVWASALRRARMLALIGDLEPIINRSDPRLFEPDMDMVAAPSSTPLVAEVVAEPLPPEPTPEHVEQGMPEADIALGYEEEPEPEPAPEPIPEPEVSWEVEPEPEPTAAEGHRRSRYRAEDESDENLRYFAADEFRAVDFFAEVVEVPGATLRIRPTNSGGLQLEWDIPMRAGAKVRIFRILSDETEFARDLRHGEPRVATIGTRWVDQEQLTKSYRMYQVWMYEGFSEAAAVQSEPQLVGEKYFILPVENIELSVAGSVITGQWEPVDNTHRVAVFAAQDSERRTRSPLNEIAKNERNLQGFQFSPQQRGVRYKFVAERFVMIGGHEVSADISEEFTIDMPAEVVEVPIEVKQTGSNTDIRFNVAWNTPHSGEVRIYRTEKPPVDGLQDRVVEVDQLESFGLPIRDHKNFRELGGTSCIVDWPEDWYSVFITPVSVVGNQALVGKSHSWVRVGEVSNAKLHQRVSTQLLTFGWPEEAHLVTAIMVAPGAGDLSNLTPDQLDPTIASSAGAITFEDYEDEGGMRVYLSSPGEVLLYPSRAYAGQQIWGKPQKVSYEGLRTFRYRLSAGNQNQIQLAIFSDRETHEHRNFTLCVRPDRLPLEPDDGEPVLARKYSAAHNGPEGGFELGLNAINLNSAEVAPVEYWELDPELLNRWHSGFLRLFITQENVPGTPVNALIDPAPWELSISEWIGRFSAAERR
ncbi:hypothetical protein [Corynebacterium sp. A21]|uniref:hypothetical protein n=1 Tax=Corynebacterium sp. A21 TaxID=3457318 RepID=UPI003FD2B693